MKPKEKFIFTRLEGIEISIYTYKEEMALEILEKIVSNPDKWKLKSKQ